MVTSPDGVSFAFAKRSTATKISVSAAKATMAATRVGVRLLPPTAAAAEMIVAIIVNL